MKKLNNYKRIWLILMILSPFFSLVKAQTCDPNILKALSETRVTYFDKVTKGEKATITIKYPLIGTTYTVTDNDGNSKSFTYTSGTQEFVDLEIDSPVNAVRRYSLKAEKDGCSYQTGFNYTITPETDVKLAIRVEQEWCGSSGAIRFKVVGQVWIIPIIISTSENTMSPMIIPRQSLIQELSPWRRASTM